jgi:RsiW-degrading membrane proteinase PrsW (M82 family)
MSWQNTLSRRSHDPGFLWRVALGIVASGFLLSFVLPAPPQALPLGDVPTGSDNPPWGRYTTGATVLAVLTGLCWLTFILHAGRSGRGGVRWPLCLAAIGLGIASAWLTLWFIALQEDTWGLQESDQLAAGVRYFVLGVGLREELAKLLLLLPLVPFLVRRGSELEALLVSACVGLGFAVEENIGYFGSSMGISSLGRLTTANFLHMSLTGLVGLAVCRGIWHPQALGPEAVAIFALAVIAHGLYDAFIAVPALSREFDIVGMIIYVLIVYRFFHEFNQARPAAAEKLNVSFTFTVGVALVASATFVYVSSLVGQSAALKLMGAELLASAATIYLFLREAPDSLIDR